MKSLCTLFFLLSHAYIFAQNPSDSAVAKQQRIIQADDPSQFFTRIEVYNELQHYTNNGDFFLNQTVCRVNIKIGKRWVTRLDLPLVYNSTTSPESERQSGLGDISLRLLGFKFFERNRSALTASIEGSLNTAVSPLLGTGKNVLIPVVSYTKGLPKSRLIVAVQFQQTNSVSGDDDREKINYSKLQMLALKTWSRRLWTTIAPEWFYDYTENSLSMNVRSRIVYSPTPRTNIWITPSVGVFGEFKARYEWSIEIGTRFFVLAKMGYTEK